MLGAVVVVAVMKVSRLNQTFLEPCAGSRSAPKFLESHVPLPGRDYVSARRQARAESALYVRASRVRSIGKFGMRSALFRAVVGAIQTKQYSVHLMYSLVLNFLREVFRGGPARLRALIVGSVWGVRP